jgi:hypothetical protein
MHPRARRIHPLQPSPVEHRPSERLLGKLYRQVDIAGVQGQRPDEARELHSTELDPTIANEAHQLQSLPEPIPLSREERSWDALAARARTSTARLGLSTPVRQFWREGALPIVAVVDRFLGLLVTQNGSE